MTEQLLFFLEIYSKVFLRYFIMASALFFIFYVLFKNKWAYKKIQKKFPKNKDYRREVTYSILSISLFAFMAILTFKSPLSPYTQIYRDINAMPLWYTTITFFIMLIVHDTYFYWMHRAMHTRKLFKIAHLVHHKSTNPSPWAAYSFHPIEAFFEAAILPIMAFLFPIYLPVFGLFFLFQIIYNVYGHLGYEIYPKGFSKHFIGKWINTSVHHNLHHKHSKYSFGLYFTFWDRLMGTMAPQYEDDFEEVKSRKARGVSLVES